MNPTQQRIGKNNSTVFGGLQTKLLLLLFLLIGSLSSAQKLKQKHYKQTSSGLVYQIIKKGKGEKTKAHYRVFISYTSKLNEDTAVFDSSPEHNKTYPYILGENEGLKGWDEALFLLHIGDSAEFIIPPHLAYGDRKISKIPAKSKIRFNVIVVAQEQAYYTIAKCDTLSLSGGIKKILVQESELPAVKPFELLTLHFTGYIVNKEGYRRIFQSSLSNSNKAVFQLGAGRLVKGLDIGISTMRVGEKATFIIPPQLGFGEEKNGIIPENSTLYFDIEVLSSKNPFFHANNQDTIYDKSGVKIIRLNRNEGDSITKDKVVTISCLTYFYDSSGHRVILNGTYENQQAMIVRCGSKVGMPGLNKSLSYLKKGDKAIVLSPPNLAYGPVRKGIIPPNTPLYHDVEILDARPYPFFDTNGKDTSTTLSGLQYISVKTSAGTKAKKNDEVGVAYTGFVLDSLGNKFIFDASRENGRLLDFSLGEEKVIKGFDEGIHGMAVGDARRLIIPCGLAYGEKGVPEAGIPAGATLFFDVELVRLKIKPSENLLQSTTKQ